jgi:hypothetical protein
MARKPSYRSRQRGNRISGRLSGFWKSPSGLPPHLVPHWGLRTYLREGRCVAQKWADQPRRKALARFFTLRRNCHSDARIGEPVSGRANRANAAVRMRTSSASKVGKGDQFRPTERVAPPRVPQPRAHSLSQRNAALCGTAKLSVTLRRAARFFSAPHHPPQLANSALRKRAWWEPLPRNYCHSGPVLE